MEGAPKPVNKIEQKEEIKNLEGIDFVFSENPELKKIALESIEPSFDDKKKIFQMLRLTLIDAVRDTSEYEKYNGKTLVVGNFSEESFELLLQGLEENNIDIKPQLDNLNKTLEEQISQEVIPTGADVMDYFNPSTGMFSDFTSKQEKQNSLQSTKHSMELLNYLETKDEKAKEVYKNYLETIFPESKVKDIMYHGSPRNDIDNFFSPESDGYKKQETTTTGVSGIYFSDKFDYAKEYIGRIGKGVKDEKAKGSIYPVLVNIQNPLAVSERYDDGMTPGTYSMTDLWNIDKDFLDHLNSNKYDAVVSGKYLQSTKGHNEIAVLDSENIHILGSQKDQEMFNEFINKENI